MNAPVSVLPASSIANVVSISDKNRHR